MSEPTSFVLDRLRRLGGAPKTRRIATVDIEATEWVNCYSVGFFDGHEFFSWVGDDCIERALFFMLRPKYAGYWIYAHNGGNYDFLFFLRELLNKREWEHMRVDITPIQSTVIRVDVGEIDYRAKPRKDGTRPTKKRRNWSFLDSVRLFPIKLDDVGETFGIGRKVKLEMSYDDLAKPENRETMLHYLEQDCRLLWRAVDHFQGVVHSLGGEMSVTLPSTALNIYRRAFLKQDVYTNRHLASCEWASQKDKKNDEKARKAKSRKATNHGGQPSAQDGGGNIPHGRGENRPLSAHGGTLHVGGIRANTRKHGSDGGGSDGGVPRTDGTRPRSVSRKRERDSGGRLEECRGCAHEFIREGYYGGRTEIFRTVFHPSPGHETASLYDINSHYPHCMLDAMPVGVMTYVDGRLTEQDVMTNARVSIGIVDCDVYIPPDCYLPPLPHRHNGKLVFPAGRFRGVWDAAELELLPLVGGRIEKVYRSGWFEAAPIFSSFIKRLYQYRDKSRPDYNPGMAWIAKILMNSAYGKFAMRERRSRILVRPERIEGLHCLDLDSDLWTETVDMSPNYVVPQLSVHVTALARVRLWQALWLALKKGGRIYYCDTDSIVCSGVEMPTGTELGALKLELGGIRRAEFVLPKLYLIDSDTADGGKAAEQTIKVKAKGMGPGIRVGETGDDPYGGQLSEKEFFEIVKSGKKLERFRLTKLKESLHGYAAKGLTFPRIVTSPKAIRSEYDKRFVLDDYDTAPIVLG